MRSLGPAGELLCLVMEGPNPKRLPKIITALSMRRSMCLLVPLLEKYKPLVCQTKPPPFLTS